MFGLDFKDRCYKGGIRHKFSPRYHTVGPTDHAMESLSRIFGESDTADLPECIDAACTQQYIYDICEWCGKIVKEHQNE